MAANDTYKVDATIRIRYLSFDEDDPQQIRALVEADLASRFPGTSEESGSLQLTGGASQIKLLIEEV